MGKNFARNGDSVDRFYIHEKISNVTHDLASITEIIDNTQISAEEKLVQIKSEVTSALFNATKILSTTGNGNWDAEDCKLIVNCGNAQVGFEAIRHKYGKVERSPEIYRNHYHYKNKPFLEKLLQERTILKTEIALRLDFCKKVQMLLDIPRNEARPQINSLLDDFQFPDACFLRMNKLVNDINMGNISDWAEFCLRMRANVEYLYSQLAGERGEHYVYSIIENEASKKANQAIAKQDAQLIEDVEPYYERMAITAGENQ